MSQPGNKIWSVNKIYSNEPIKFAHPQKLANQSIMKGALVIKIVSNSFSESKKNFCRLMKQGEFFVFRLDLWK